MFGRTSVPESTRCPPCPPPPLPQPDSHREAAKRVVQTLAECDVSYNDISKVFKYAQFMANEQKGTANG